VAIGGKAAPLHFASSGQVNAILPFGIADNTPLQMIVRRGATPSLPQQVVLGSAQPAIFSLDGTGGGQGYMVRVAQDGTQAIADNASPARPGDALVVYATGLGVVTPPVPEGQGAPTDQLSMLVNPIDATIQGKKAQVLFAGLVPLLTGIYQVNLIVPSSVT
jgi:uncharacterized protein (TIGR03437 family)